ncbi:MAG: LLM class flavin-dependent oxidoreductase [Gammaproteobacteria bacterium]|nr:LLM class flavin-dependent oxidoreductase [Gammaproteobacteria bacterium]
MDVDIILECDVPPAQVAELAVVAEQLGIRALWSSNYHQNWDAFMTLMPAAAATSRIMLGALAISPWELHPLKMANSALTLNEASNGRGMVAISGGGGVLGALGWKISPNAPLWPAADPVSGARYPERRVRGVRECIDILKQARSGKLSWPYEGQVFQVTRPFQMDWAKAAGPVIYGCCSGPQMIRMGAAHADAIQVSDFTVDMLPAAMDNVRRGLARRAEPADGFRVGNFWAWHVKRDREVSMYEARRELIWRGAVAAKHAHELRPFCQDDEEVKLIVDNWDNFFKAFWTRSGQIDGVPDELVNRLIAGLSSAGDLSDLDRELERVRQFADSGLTELSLRLFDDPLDGLQMIGEHVLPVLH